MSVTALNVLSVGGHTGLVEEAGEGVGIKMVGEKLFVVFISFRHSFPGMLETCCCCCFWDERRQRAAF